MQKEDDRERESSIASSFGAAAPERLQMGIEDVEMEVDECRVLQEEKEASSRHHPLPDAINASPITVDQNVYQFVIPKVQ
jgi:hypothetical protein